MLVASSTSTSTRPLTDPPTVRLSRREIERRMKELRSLELSRDGVSVENLSSSGMSVGLAPCLKSQCNICHIGWAKSNQLQLVDHSYSAYT